MHVKHVTSAACSAHALSHARPANPKHEKNLCILLLIAGIDGHRWHVCVCVREKVRSTSCLRVGAAKHPLEDNVNAQRK